MSSPAEMRARLEAIRARARRQNQLRSEAYARSKVLGTSAPVSLPPAIRSSTPTTSLLSVRASNR